MILRNLRLKLRNGRGWDHYYKFCGQKIIGTDIEIEADVSIEAFRRCGSRAVICLDHHLHLTVWCQLTLKGKDGIFVECYD